MRTYNANLYADHIENLLNETPTPFLDVDELSYLLLRRIYFLHSHAA